MSTHTHTNTHTQGDPFRTLFISRLSYDVTEKKLRKEFEEYGPIKRVRLVTDKSGEFKSLWVATAQQNNK